MQYQQNQQHCNATVLLSCALTENSGMPHFDTMLLRSMIIWLLSTAYAICCTPNTSLQAQASSTERGSV
jgi:hypothetical protein